MNIRAVIFDIYNTLLHVGPPPPDADARWQRLWRDLLHMEPRFTRLDFSIASSKVIARHHEVSNARGIRWPEVHWPSVVTEVIPEVTQLPRTAQEEFIFRQIRTGHTTHVTAETAATLRWLKDREMSENTNELNPFRFWMLREARRLSFSKECSSRPPDRGIVFR